MSLKLIKAHLLLIAALAACTRADQDIYVDGLASGWADWSYKTTTNFALADPKKAGTCISATSQQAWTALSLHSNTAFGGTFAGLKFDVLAVGASPDLYIALQTGDTVSPSVRLSALSSSINANGWTTVTVDFNALPPSCGTFGTGSWDRINFQASAAGISYRIDNIKLLSTLPGFRSAEPLASNTIAVTTSGSVDINTVTVKLNNANIGITSRTSYNPVDESSKTIWYLTLAQALSPGTLVISAPSGCASFTHTLPAAQSGTVNLNQTTLISPEIYGVNWATSNAYMYSLGVSLARWGGNTASTYNPNGDYINAGNDYYYENRKMEFGNADAWIGWVKPGPRGPSRTMMAVPALDWVAKDASSYSYPKSVYPSQSSFDPYKPDAGSGLQPDGKTPVTPNTDPNRAYTKWDMTALKNWLSGMTNRPQIVTIDNEIEIASGSHRDIHPNPVNYDEELDRIVKGAKAVKEVWPFMKVAAPSTNSWWYFWTSEVGYSDNAAHGNMDFLPWFLEQMRNKEDTEGRLIDYLDIHYYFAADTSTNDAAAKAKRLRQTRSLWDETYIDESWIGTNTIYHQQPNGHAVMLIPRMRNLLRYYYSALKLSISEWSANAPKDDITGGLVAADVLGIFGRYQVDAAAYWMRPDEQSPVACAFWLYNGYGINFPQYSVKVQMADKNENVLGVYAGALDSSGWGLTVVIVNKDTKPVALNLANVASGSYFMRHFGGQAGASKYQTTITLTGNSYIVVPAYTATFLQKK